MQKPVSSSFDSLAKADAKKAESRTNYEKATAPASTFKTGKGTEAKIDPKAKEVERLRSELDHQKWVNRTQRSTTFYRGYVTAGYAPIYYSDPFHPALNYWLLSRSIDDMAFFVYHHSATMDRERIAALYAKNAGLQAKVAALEAQKLARDPSWVPKDVDLDMVYDDNYVDAVYNPLTKTVTEYEYDEGSGFWSGLWSFIVWVFWLALILAVIAAVLWGLHWLLFKHRYNY